MRSYQKPGLLHRIASVWCHFSLTNHRVGKPIPHFVSCLLLKRHRFVDIRIEENGIIRSWRSPEFLVKQQNSSTMVSSISRGIASAPFKAAPCPEFSTKGCRFHSAMMAIPHVRIGQLKSCNTANRSIRHCDKLYLNEGPANTLMARDRDYVRIALYFLSQRER